MDFMPWVWLLGGLIIMCLEFVVPGFIIFFFGLGALITSLCTFLIPGLDASLPFQFLIWMGSSLLTLGFFRRFFKNTFRGKVIKDDGADDFVGKLGTVVEAITDNRPGRISFQGTTWKAEAFNETLQPGDVVEIQKKENLTLFVTKRN